MLARLRAPAALRALAAPATRRLCAAAPPPAELVPPEEMGLALRRRVASLEALHAKFEQLEEEHTERQLQLELEFAESSHALYRRRQDIVAGGDEPTDEEVRGSVYFSEIVSDDEPAAGDGADPPGVPLFWPTAMRMCPSLSDIEGFAISDADWAVFQHLTELSIEPWDAPPEAAVGGEMFEMMQQLQEASGEQGMPLSSSMAMDAPGFALRFKFSPNEFLEGDEMVLYCNGNCEVLDLTAPVWREGADPTVRLVTKKVKKRGQPTVKQLVPKPAESFFRIFAIPNSDEMDFDDEGEPVHRPGELLPVAGLQEELLFRLREDLVPRAGMYYISALNGGSLDDDDDWGPDGEDFGGPEEWEEPPRGRR